jgi:nucleotide-binding universal stress UspA family protein
MSVDLSKQPKPLRTILVPTDFSDHARHALRWAMDLALPHGASIVLVHAVEPHPFGRAGEVDRLFTEAAEVELAKEAQVLKDAKTPFTTLALHGKPWRVITETAAGLNADLIVIGSRGLNAIARVMIGSTADRVIRTATVPVLTVHPEDSLPAMRTVLAATDLSDGSTLAIQAARRIMSVVPEFVRLILLHVSPPPYVMGSIEVSAALMPDWNEIERSSREGLERVASAIRGDGLGVEPEVARGFPANTILQKAKEYRPDIIVLGTHGATGLDRMLLGSVAEKVLHHAACPVLTVRTPSRELITEDDAERLTNVRKAVLAQ